MVVSLTNFGYKGSGKTSRMLYGGFTLVELIVVVAVLTAVSAIAIPVFTSYRDRCRVMAAAAKICTMMKEAKQNALVDEKYYGVGFSPASGEVSLISEKGSDGKWNTADDRVLHSFQLAKDSGVCFGYGSCGPLPGLAATSDGITFQTNTAVCNPDLTGNAGTVYITSGSAAMAITLNSKDFTYSLWRWGGKQWVRM